MTITQMTKCDRKEMVSPARVSGKPLASGTVQVTF